uniref:Uncharacterized protein n=1 Tax=Kalanchoe fedtschenkoi TaxID=63787 RepID=A0A7N0TVE4_KALFE
MEWSTASPPVSHPLALLSFLCLITSCFSQDQSLKGINVANPAIELTPSMFLKDSNSGSKDVLACERVQVTGISRWKLGSYASSLRVTVAPSVAIPERLHAKIQVCFHHNASLAVCQCDKDDWKNIHKGFWTSSMSPYDERYVDVKFSGEIFGSVAITVEEDAQRWRLFCLALGFMMLLLAPVVSSWVPFYYSSSMFIGVLLVVIILLFQGMKLLPTGRKSAFYLTIYGSLLGAGSFLLHHFSMMINSILVNFGLSEEMHNPVSILVLVLIVLAGAGLGYWIVRRYIVSEDGKVDAGITQFVKWAMRILGSTLILQSTLDTLLAFGALVSCWSICIAIHSAKWIFQELDYSYGVGDSWLWRGKKKQTRHGRAEFLSKKSRFGKEGTLWNSPKMYPAFKNSPEIRNSPATGIISPSSSRQTTSVERDHYSTFHKTPRRKKFSRREWEEFTEESTRKAMAELASSPEFTEWIMENANRITLRSDDSSIESEADSSNETVVGNENNMINQIIRW